MPEPATSAQVQSSDALAVTNQILGGWQVSGATTFKSGFPLAIDSSVETRTSPGAIYSSVDAARDDFHERIDAGITAAVRSYVPGIAQ